MFSKSLLSEIRYGREWITPYVNNEDYGEFIDASPLPAT